ncbi:MAG TPA: YkgJ family cysteine cluster protein [Syntrophorhabdaceae bacterium]|nr:YkgJ family cysteine cluster protein [Syntrophorhabdaceae bacterium]
MNTDPLKDYMNLRQWVDGEANRLVTMHGGNITCHRGCDGCCVNLTVFPVEFFAIMSEMKRAGVHAEKISFDEIAPCGFLHERICRIYPYRPIICRTHGLPILFIDDSSDEPRWDVSYCELNFSASDETEFTGDMLLDVERINAELNRINRDFIVSVPDKKYQSHTRIPLRELCSAKKGSLRLLNGPHKIEGP